MSTVELARRYCEFSRGSLCRTGADAEVDAEADAEAGAEVDTELCFSWARAILARPTE